MQGPVGKNTRSGQSGRSFSNVFSRTAKRVKSNLGIIFASDRAKIRKVRNKDLEVFDRYYDGKQYDHLPPWDTDNAKDGEYIPIRKRKPRINYNMGKVLVQRVTSKLVGEGTFPLLKVEDSPDDTAFIAAIVKAAKLKARLVETVNYMGRSGAALSRFYIVEGSLHVETYHAKYCYPQFQNNGDLAAVNIQYVYEDCEDLDANGNPKAKWYRLDLGMQVDILYDNPEFKDSVQPTFTPVSEAPHNLGFVQAEWFRTTEDKHSPDGISLLNDVLDFIDEMNYSLSQASQAVGYGQEPQMTIKGMDADELDSIVKSSQKTWNLGRDGEANFVETDLGAVKQGQEMRDKIRLAVQDVARVVFFDPEKSASHATSGKAMEVMHGPMIELINELRPMLEDRIASLVTKIAVTLLTLNEQGLETDLQIPDGYMPESLDITVSWPVIFPPTLEDLNTKVTATALACSSNLLSRESGTHFIGPDFGVEDLDAEMEKIAAQPPINPFGDTMGGMGGGAFGGKPGGAPGGEK